MKIGSNLLAIATACCMALLTGCAEDPAANKPAAKVESPAKAPADQPPKTDAPAKADPAAAAPTAEGGSSDQAADGLALTGDIIFVGAKVTSNHVCKFTDWAGAATLAGDDITKMAFKFTVQTKGIAADYEAPSKWSGKLEDHLRSDDFFASETHPTASFASTGIVAKAGEGSTHEVTGKLTIKGIEKVVTFPATIALEGGKVKAKAEFSINRKDFKIMYDGKPDNLIRDDVLLKLDFKS